MPQPKKKAAAKKPAAPSISAEEKAAAREETREAKSVESMLAELAKPISDEFATKLAERDRLQAERDEAVAKLDADLRAAAVPLEADMSTLAEAFHRVTGNYPAGFAAPKRAPKRSAGGGSGVRAPRGENQAKILAVVGDRPGVSPTEIAQATGIKREVVYTTLTKLVDKSQVIKEELPGGGVGYKAA